MQLLLYNETRLYLRKQLKYTITNQGNNHMLFTGVTRQAKNEDWEVVEVIQAVPTPRDDWQEKPMQFMPRIRAFHNTMAVSGNQSINHAGTHNAAAIQSQTQAHKSWSEFLEGLIEIFFCVIYYETPCMARRLVWNHPYRSFYSITDNL